MQTLRVALVSAALLAAPAFAQDPPAPAAADAPKGAKPAKKKLVDVNSASADELKALPGVDDAMAQKIIAGRPYKGKDQLLKQKLVDATEYAKIRPLIHAYQPKGAAAAKGEKPATPAPTATKPAAAQPPGPMVPAPSR